MANALRARGAVPHSMLLAMPLTMVAIVLTLTLSPLARADCDSLQFGTRIGPPAMAQPDGNIHTVAGNCTGVPNCEDFFDIALETGDALYLSFCNDGGSANFETELSIFRPFPFEWGNTECESYACGNQAEATYVAAEAGIHRIRIGHAETQTPLDGNYVLAYSAPAGRVIAAASCGNGTLDAGEECDDGNSNDGDCCSRGCTYDPVDAECLDEGNDCTFNLCDGAGTCTHTNKGSGTACFDGEAAFCTADTCDGSGTCTHVPIPGCNMLPVCGVPQSHPAVTYPHPAKALKFEMSLVQAFVGCNTVDGNAPNATTETGTVPSCYPAETFDERDGSPPGGWRWGPYGKGYVKFSNRCKDAGDTLIKFAMYNIVDGAGVPVDGDGILAIAARLTIMDPVGGEMTTVDIPLSLQFTVVGGAAKMLTSLNAMLTDQDLGALPNGFTFTLAPVHPLDGGLLEIRDANGNAFARPGVYLP